MLAATNSLVPVTKPPLNASKTIAVVLNHPVRLHIPHYIVHKEKVVSGTAEKYCEIAPTFFVYLFGSTMLLKALLNHLR